MRALLPVAGVAFFGGTGAGTLAFLVPVWWMGSVTTDALLRLRGHGGKSAGRRKFTMEISDFSVISNH